jgi:hypothetical protein
VALENYTRGQKILMIFLVVLGAALFTVTGTMMAAAESCGQDSSGQIGMIAGQLNGNDVNTSLFMARRQLMENPGASPIITVPPSEAMQTLLVSAGAIEGTVPTTGRQFAPVRLFDLWPKYHDQHVWMFSVLAARAQAAGFRLPPVGAAAEYMFGSSDGTTMTEEDRRKHFEARGQDPAIVLRAVAELMVINDYVAAINARHTSSYTDDMEQFGNRFDERMARIYRLDSNRFRAQAEADVDRQAATAHLGKLVSSLSGAGAATDALTPTEFTAKWATGAEKEVLEDKQLVAFDLIRADITELARSMGDASREEIEAFYYNTRGQTFRVAAGDATDERVEQRFESVLRTERELRRGEEPSEDWKKSRKADLKHFYDFHERRVDIERELRRFRAEEVGRLAITNLHREIEEIRNRRTKESNAANASLDEWKRGADALKAFHDEIGRQIDNFTVYPLTRAHDVLATWGDETKTDAAAVNNLMSGISDAIIRTVGNSAAGQSLTFRSYINLDRERRTVRDRELEVEDAETFVRDNPPGEEDFDGKQRVRRAQYRLEAAREKLAEAEALLAKAVGFCDDLQGWLFEIEMRASAAKESPNAAALLKAILNDFVVTYPAKIADLRKQYFTGDRKAEIEAEITSRERIVSRERTLATRKSQDMTDLNFSSMVNSVDVGRGRTVSLIFDPGIDRSEPVTMQQLARDNRFFWIESITEAKNFLTTQAIATDGSRSLPNGAVSQVINRPGHGFYLLRLRHARPKLDLSPAERPEQARELAVRRRMRELAKQEAERIRIAAAKAPNATAWLDQQVADGKLSAVNTDWFGWAGAVNLSGGAKLSVAPNPDDAGTTGLDENNPNRPFFQSLQAIGPSSPVGTPFIEGEVNNWDRRALEGNFWYSLPVLTARRHKAGEHVPYSTWELDNLRLSSIISARRMLADPEYEMLLDPAKLMEGYSVVYNAGHFEARGKRGEEAGTKK